MRLIFKFFSRYSFIDRDREELKLVSFLGAVAVFLSAIEYMIPKPMPFVRLGLSNLSVLLAIRLLNPSYVFLVVLLKVFGQGIIQGTLLSYVFLFSVGGSFGSAIVMIIASRVGGEYISLIGVSVLGALTSNVIQIILARFFVFGKAAWYMAPPFLLIGGISGFFIGIFVEVFWLKSKWVVYVRKKLKGD